MTEDFISHCGKRVPSPGQPQGADLQCQASMANLDHAAGEQRQGDALAPREKGRASGATPGGARPRDNAGAAAGTSARRAAATR